MLHIQIDPHSGIPIYRQVMDQVRYYAASGVLRPGALLPSIRDLAKALAVNPTTIVKAYTELQHEGVIEMRHGKGAFLAERANAPSPEACARALERIARQLAVEASEMGASREQVVKIVEDELARLRASQPFPLPPGASVVPSPSGRGQGEGALPGSSQGQGEAGNPNG